MHVKTVCTNCGEICRTGSIKNFRHCGIEQNVKANLLAGEEEKFKKLVAKKTGKPVEIEKVPKAPEVAKPLEEIAKKVEAKQAEKPAIEPIIVEKVPEAPIVEKEQLVRKKRKKKSSIEEKVKREIPAEDVYSFGFFSD